MLHCLEAKQWSGRCIQSPLFNGGLVEATKVAMREDVNEFVARTRQCARYGLIKGVFHIRNTLVTSTDFEGAEEVPAYGQRCRSWRR